MTTDEAIKKVEAAGFYWAIEGGPNGEYLAVVERKNNYVGDGLAGPGAHDGATPAEALLSALERAVAS